MEDVVQLGQNSSRLDARTANRPPKRGEPTVAIQAPCTRDSHPPRSRTNDRTTVFWTIILLCSYPVICNTSSTSPSLTHGRSLAASQLMSPGGSDSSPAP
uniref:Uncharacterized protein n=1 Tax=Knipowitschia caucasica TaxID=637954 RepID=A0AAV2LU81_KNICA